MRVVSQARRIAGGHIYLSRTGDMHMRVSLNLMVHTIGRISDEYLQAIEDPIGKCDNPENVTLRHVLHTGAHPS